MKRGSNDRTNIHRNRFSVPPVSIFLLLLLPAGCFLFNRDFWDDPPEFPRNSEIKSLGEMDYNWSLLTLDGELLRLEDYKNKVLFITTWDTLCGSCQAQIPSLQLLFDSMANTGVEFLFLSGDERSAMRSYLQARDLTLPVAIFDKPLPEILRSPASPSTFIVNREGSVVFRHIGAAKWDTQPCRHFLYGLLR